MSKKKICDHEISYVQEGRQFFNVSLDKDGNIDYERDDFDTNDCGTFFCTECDEEFSEKEAIEIFKKQQKK